MYIYIQVLFPRWLQYVAISTTASFEVYNTYFCCWFPRCLATETVTRELSAMRLKLLAMEFDLQATKAELREIKGKLQCFMQSDRTAGKMYLLGIVFDL